MKRGRMAAFSNTTSSEYTVAASHCSGGQGVDGGAVTYTTCASYFGTCPHSLACAHTQQLR